MRRPARRIRRTGSRRCTSSGRRSRPASRPPPAPRRRTAAAGRTGPPQQEVGGRQQQHRDDREERHLGDEAAENAGDVGDHEPVLVLQRAQRLRSGNVTVLIRGRLGDCVTPPPGVFTKISADRNRVMPAPRMVTATPATMWSTPKETVAMARIDRQRSAEDADDHPPPRPELVRAPGAEPGPEDQLTLQADVHHAGPLGPQAAEAGQPDRHREPQRRAGGAAGGDVVGAGDQPDDRDEHEHAGDAQQPDRPTNTPAASLRRRGFGHRLDQAGGGHAGLPSPVVAAARSSAPTRRCCCASENRRTSSYAMTTDSTVTPCMIVTISFGTPSRSRIWADCSRNDRAARRSRCRSASCGRAARSRCRRSRTRSGSPARTRGCCPAAAASRPARRPRRR